MYFKRSDQRRGELKEVVGPPTVDELEQRRSCQQVPTEIGWGTPVPITAAQIFKAGAEKRIPKKPTDTKQGAVIVEIR